MMGRFSLVAVATVASMVAACSCGDDETKEECPDASVTISSPPDASQGRLTTDEDPAAAGVQATLRASTVAAPAGTAFEIVVNGEALPPDVATATVAEDGSITVPGITLANGNNTLALRATICERPVSDTIAVIVDIPVGPACRFDDPVDGATLGASRDLDRTAEGLQYDVSASCDGGTSGVDATLLVNGEAAGTASFGPGGAVTFEGATLPEGTVVLQLQSEAGDARAEVRVDLSVGELLLSGPARVGIADDRDGDPANGLQVRLTAEGTALGEGDEVTVDCGGATATATVQAARATLDVTLAPLDCAGADFLCVATKDAVTSNTLGIHADAEAPAIVLVEPAEALVCTPTPTVSAVVTCLEAGRLVGLTRLEPNDAHTALADPKEPDGQGRVSWAPSELYADAFVEGASTMFVEGDDGAGNPFGLASDLFVDLTVPAPAFRSPTAGETIAAGRDEDGDLSNGLQLDVVVDVGDRDDSTIALEQRVGGVRQAGPFSPSRVANGVATFDNLTLLDGPIVLAVTVDDGCHPPVEALVDVTVQTGNPTCAINRPLPGSVLGSANQQVEVFTSLAAGSLLTLEVTDPAGTTTPVTFSSTGATTTTAVVLGGGDGGYSLLARCGAGVSPAVGVTLDTVAPAISLAVPDSGGGVINMFVADADPASIAFEVLATITADPATGGGIQDGAVATVQVRCSDGSTFQASGAFSGNQALVAAPATDGASCTFTASAVDAAANPSNVATTTRTVDRTPPAVTGCTPSGATGVPDVTLACSFANAAVGDSLVVVDSAQPATPVLSGAVTDPSGFSLPLGTLADGSYLYTVSVTDSAGNVQPANVAFVVDTVAPTVDIERPLPGAVYNVFSDVNSGTPEVDFEVRITASGVPNGTEFWVCSGLGVGPACPAGGGFRIDGQVTTVAGTLTPVMIAFPNGVHDLYVYLADAAGNVASAPPPRQVTIDGVPPRVAAITLLDDADANGTLNAAELAAGAGQLRASVLVADDPANAFDGAEGSSLTLQVGGASSTAVVTGGVAAGLALALGEGVHTLDATVADAIGNPNRRAANPTISNPESLLQVTVDTLPPSVTFLRPGGVWEQSTLPPLAVRTDAPPGATVEFLVDGGAACTAQVQADGTATCSPSAPLSETLHTFEARVTDAAGNQGAGTVQATVDATPPQVWFTSPTAGQAFAANPVAVSFGTIDAPIGAWVEFTSPLRPGFVFRAAVQADGTATSSADLSPGAAQTLSATVADAAGNIASATSPAFDVVLAGCVIYFEAPSSNEAIYDATMDLDPAAPGLQTGVTVYSDCVGQTVTLTVDGGAVQSAPVAADGRVAFSIVIPDGSIRVPVHATITSGGGVNSDAEYLATVDLAPPSFVSSMPAGDFRLVGAGHPGGPGVFVDASPGLPASMDLTFDVAGANGGTVALLIDGGEVGRRSVTADPQTIVFSGVLFTQGAQQALEAVLTDAGNNVARLTSQATVDVLAPAAPTGPAVQMTDVRGATAELTFGEPAADAGGAGTVAALEIRWSTQPMTDATFATGTLVAAPAPAGPGAPVTVAASVPPLSSSYHLCARATDAIGHVGPIGCASTSHGWTVSSYTGTTAGTLYGFQTLFLGDIGSSGGGPDGFGDFAATELSASSGGNVHVFFGGPNLSALPFVTLSALASGEQFGFRVAAGDLDGDGTPDLAVGSPAYSSSRGRVTIFFGGAGGPTRARSVELRDLAGQARRFGRSVSVVGDVGSPAGGADGIADLFVSAAYEDAPAGSGTGFVFFGRSQAAWTALAQNLEGNGPFVPASAASGADGRTFVGDAAGDHFSFRYGASSLGDLDGDGLDELGIPASGVNEYSVFDGAVVAGAQGVTLTPAANAIRTMTEPAGPPGIAYHGFGHDAVGGVDLGGDGFPDLIVGNAYTSTVFVYAGDAAAQDIPATAVQTLQVQGPVAGWELEVADVTGDGRPDLLVGSDDPTANLVAVYRNQGGAQPLETAPAILSAVGLFGVGVAAGDLDGDGRSEVVVGAPTDGAGTVRVYSP